LVISPLFQNPASLKLRMARGGNTMTVSQNRRSIRLPLIIDSRIQSEQNSISVFLNQNARRDFASGVTPGEVCAFTLS
jgi:hypothetical protein